MMYWTYGDYFDWGCGPAVRVKIGELSGGLPGVRSRDAPARYVGAPIRRNAQARMVSMRTDDISPTEREKTQ